MAKITEVIKLKSGYANFVELKSAFEEAQENADRMAMYRPTKSHRQAFERLCRGLYQPNDKKFYLLSGSYGTGKSHLCLMYSNFLSRSSGDPEIKGFYDNYEKLDPDTAKMLKNIRKDGQYLVAICDYHAGRKFEEVVLKAIFEACRKKGLDAGVQTEFDEAERLLADWEKKSKKEPEKQIRNFFGDFTKVLNKIALELPIEQLRSRLKDYDLEALRIFRSAFKETMGGIEFQAQSGNLIPIVKELVHSKAFKERFKGLAILFDEFGFILEKSLWSKDVFQGFMETVCKNEPNVLFVGCIHKDFRAYADRFSKEDINVMTARITHVDLFNEGIEEIISAIVETDKDSQIWKEIIHPKTGVFDQLVPVCSSLKLFPWIEDTKRIRKRVLEDIYGVHPMALACLLRLSLDIGSDARSTFTYFSGEVGGEEGSYADFINKADITLNGGKLNLYTVDQLLTFFKSELSLKNPDLRPGQRQLVNGYHASQEALRKVPQEELFEEKFNARLSILRTILIYQMCQIPTNLENIQFGLYCLTQAEQKQIEGHLKYLAKIGAVFYRQQSKTYELAVGTGEDPYDLIDRYLNNPDLHPKNIVETFLEQAGEKQELEFLVAKQYNLHFNEDKRFKCHFIKAKDLGNELWDELGKKREENSLKERHSYEGDVIYVLCEDDSDIQIAKNVIQEIPHLNIAIAISQNSQPFTENLLKAMACRYYLPPSEAEKISAQTESRLRDILEDPDDGYLPILKRTLRSIMSGENACWYGQKGKVIVDQPKQSHKVADMLGEDLFSKRCRIKHPDLNLTHDDRWRTSKNTALKQAVNVLLKADRVMIDNGNPDSHGEKRYLEKVLLKGAGALRKIDSDGTITYFECESDSEKISEDFPILKDLCGHLAELEKGAALSVRNFIEKAKSDPYGMGGTALVLALANIIRAYGERLRIFKDSTKTVEMLLNDYDELASVISDPSTKVVFEVKELSVAQIKLIDGIAKAVHAPPLKHGEIRTLNSCNKALIDWWNDLSRVSKIVALYEKDKQQRIEKLKGALDEASGVDRFELILQRIPSVYTEEPVGEELSENEAEKITEEFGTDVKLLDSGYHRIRNSIGEAVSEVFGAKGDLVQCEKTMMNWYEGLSPNQRDPYKYTEEDAVCLMKRISDSSLNFESKLLTCLPEDFSFGSVSQWSSIHTKDFVARVKQAKIFIDEAKPEVPEPEIESKTWKIQEGESLEIDIPKGASKIIYTSRHDDPINADDYKVTEQKLDLVQILGDQPNVTVNMRALDNEGNPSKIVTVKLINKAKEYEIQVEKDLFESEKGSFKFPEDSKGLISVIKSLLNHGVKKGFINRDLAQKIIESINLHLNK